MIVYLDQNKWIELARAINGVENTDEAELLRRKTPAVLGSGCIFPLSAIHIIEFSRIKKDERRARLGKVMWNFSRGKTTSPMRDIICWELELAYSRAGYQIIPKPFEYLGRGIPHAFGEVLDGTIAKMFPDEIDRAMLCGLADIPPIQGGTKTYRENFVNHLSSLHERKHDLDRSKWQNWLYAISMVDILDPLHKVMTENRIPNGEFEAWGAERLSEFLETMPTRAVDIHLHRQVLKNPAYKPKLSDLEDWAGLGPAACYADVVICEKHFADLLRRDGFKTKAKIETSLCSFFQRVG